MASTAQELVNTIINVAVFKSIFRYINELRKEKRALQNLKESPSHHISLSNIDNQIHLLNGLFHQICSSLSSRVEERLSFNCDPVTLGPHTAVSFIEGGGITSSVNVNLNLNLNLNPRRGVVEPGPSGKPSYLSVAAKAASASKLKENTIRRISISTSAPHELANTIVNDLVFKCIVKIMDDLLKAKEMALLRNKSLVKIIDDQRCLIAKVMSMICTLLQQHVEGAYNISPRGILGAPTRVAFIEGCYVKEEKKPELSMPSYLSLANGREPLGPLRYSSHAY